jgi:hypothetical protein
LASRRGDCLDDVSGPAAAAFTAFFAATAIAGYRYRAFPAPVAGLAALAAITQPLTFGIALTDSGPLSENGFLGEQTKDGAGYKFDIEFKWAAVPSGAHAGASDTQSNL